MAAVRRRPILLRAVPDTGRLDHREGQGNVGRDAMLPAHDDRTDEGVRRAADGKKRQTAVVGKSGVLYRYGQADVAARVIPNDVESTADPIKSLNKKPPVARCGRWLILLFIFQIDHTGFVGVDNDGIAALAYLRDAMIV